MDDMFKDLDFMLQDKSKLTHHCYELYFMERSCDIRIGGEEIEKSAPRNANFLASLNDIYALI
jgi:hypothetical protein